MKIRHMALLSLLALVLMACGGRTETTPEPTPKDSTPARPTPSESPLPEPGTSPLSPLAPPTDPIAAAAVAYLATELNVPPDRVLVLSIEPVNWPDASLGCPQPGMMYAQVISPGYRIVLEAGGEQYDLHTDQTGQKAIICGSDIEDLSTPEAAFQTLLAHLTQTFPGFGLNQQEEWASQDITTAGLLGSSTWAWRSGEWTLEMTFPIVPQPSYECVLFHQQAGTVWSGTLETGDQVTPTYDEPSLSFDPGSCDESIPPDSLQEWAKLKVSVENGAIHVEQNLSYVCCAELALAAGRDGEIIRIIETNVGEVCRCMCGYAVTADLTGLPSGTYTVEVWGVQHFDVHPLEMLGSAKVTIP